MVSAGLVALVFCVGLALGVLWAGRAGNLRRLFIRLSWIPSAALLLEYALAESLTRTLSYASILVPLLTCVASLVFAVIGVSLVASEGQDRDRRRMLLYATVVSALPGALLIVYILSSGGRR